MKKNILLLLLLIVCSVSSAQTVLLGVDTQKDQTPSERGQNLKRFTQAFIHFGFVAGADNPGARIKYGSSINLGFGLRNKFKISPLYSLGFDFEFAWTSFELKQESGKILPDTIINTQSGGIDYSFIGLGFYNRFNFDTHRGNFIGTYLDLGIMGTWDFVFTEFSENDLPNGTTINSQISNLDYNESFNSRAYFRFGYSHISVYGSYRLMDLFKKSYNYPDLPRLIIGLEIGLY